MKYISEDPDQFIMKMGVLMNQGLDRGDALKRTIQNMNNVI